MRGLGQLFSRKKPESRNVVASPLPYEPEIRVDEFFWRKVGEKHPNSVMEVGTLQSVPGRSTHCMARFPHLTAKDYLRVDIIEGADVDVVADLHNLPQDWSGRFDCVIANAVFEHLDRPWIAAKEVARVLAPGGMFLVMTHQCFPIHGYPSDFFRFSDAALRLIFEDAGLTVDVCDYNYRCMIVPPKEVVPDAHVVNWNSQFPSYIHVAATGHKPPI